MDSKIVIELGDEDLKQLREIFTAARMRTETPEAGDIIAACRRLLAEARGRDVPRFIMNRLEQLEELVAMVEDDEWQLPAPDVKRVIHALAYFANTKDIIPDDVPGLGYLDDAVMVDLVMMELHSEVKAYRSFRKFLEEESARRRAQKDDTPVTRADWLNAQRKRVEEARRPGWIPWKRKNQSFLD